MMAKLAVFDFDSTLMDGETIDFLAKPLGLEEQVRETIADRAKAKTNETVDTLAKSVRL